MTNSTNNNNFTSRPSLRSRGPSTAQEAEIQRLSNPRSIQDFVDALATPGTPAFQKMMNLIAANVQATNVIDQLIDMYVMQQVKLNQEEKEAIYKGMVAKENAEKEKAQNSRLSDLLSQQHRLEIAKILEPDIIMKMFEERAKQERILGEDVRRLSAVYVTLGAKQTEIIGKWQDNAKKNNAAFVNAMKANNMEFSFVNAKGELIRMGADSPRLLRALEAAAGAAQPSETLLRQLRKGYKLGPNDNTQEKPATAVSSQTMDIDSIKANSVKLNSSLTSLMMAIKGPGSIDVISREQQAVLDVLQAVRNKLQQNVNAISISNGDVNKAQMAADMKEAVNAVNKAMADYKNTGKESPQVAAAMQRFNANAMAISNEPKPAAPIESTSAAPVAAAPKAPTPPKAPAPPPPPGPRAKAAEPAEREELNMEFMANQRRVFQQFALLQELGILDSLPANADVHKILKAFIKDNNKPFDLYGNSLSNNKQLISDYVNNFLQKTEVKLDLDLKKSQQISMTESMQSLANQYKQLTGKALSTPAEKIEQAPPRTPFSMKPPGMSR